MSKEKDPNKEGNGKPKGNEGASGVANKPSDQRGSTTIEFNKRRIIKPSGEPFDSDDDHVVVTPEHLFANLVSGATALDAIEQYANPILKKIRRAKAKSVKIPDIELVQIVDNVHNTFRIYETQDYLQKPDVISRVMNINVAGFINQQYDKYMTKDNGVNKDGVWTDEAIELVGTSNSLSSIYFKDGISTSSKDYGIHMIKPTYEKSGISIYEHPIKYNKMSDSVVSSIVADNSSIEYKKSLNLIRRSIVQKGASHLFDGLTTIARKPAIFRSMIEQPIILSTLIKLIVDSINNALSNQSLVIEKFGLPDPIVQQIFSLSRAERARLFANIKPMIDYANYIPYNKAVYDAFSDLVSPVKRTTDGIDVMGNAILFPTFNLVFPTASIAKSERGDDDEFLPKYSNGTLGTIQSGITNRIYFRSGSILSEFIQFFDAKVPNGKHASHSLSGVTFTPFMTSVIMTLLNKSPRFLSNYKIESSDFWAALIDREVFKDTIFAVASVSTPDFNLKGELTTDIPVVSSRHTLFSTLPNNWKILGDNAEYDNYSIITKEDFNGFNMDPYVNGLYKCKLKGKNEITGDINIILNDGIISPVIVYDKQVLNSKALPVFTCHDYNYDNISSRIATEGNNYHVSKDCVLTYTANPFLSAIYTETDLNSKEIGIITTANDDKIRERFFRNVSIKEARDYCLTYTCPSIYTLGDIFNLHSIFNDGARVQDKYTGYGRWYELKLRRRVDVKDTAADVEYQDIY